MKYQCDPVLSILEVALEEALESGEDLPRFPMRLRWLVWRVSPRSRRLRRQPNREFLRMGFEALAAGWVNR